MRYSRGEHAHVQAVQDEVARAEADYQRLRQAWLRLARDEPDNEVGLAMLAADLQRAQARVQAVTAARTGGAPAAGGKH